MTSHAMVRRLGVAQWVHTLPPLACQAQLSPPSLSFSGLTKAQSYIAHKWLCLAELAETTVANSLITMVGDDALFIFMNVYIACTT